MGSCDNTIGIFPLGVASNQPPNKTNDTKERYTSWRQYIQRVTEKGMQEVAMAETAVKFTDKGSIRLSYEGDKSRHMLRLFIEDTGIGLKPEQGEPIFEHFYKADPFTKRVGLYAG